MVSAALSSMMSAHSPPMLSASQVHALQASAKKVEGDSQTIKEAGEKETPTRAQLIKDVDRLRATNEKLRKKNETVAMDSTSAKEASAKEARHLRERIGELAENHKEALKNATKAAQTVTALAGQSHADIAKLQESENRAEKAEIKLRKLEKANEKLSLTAETKRREATKAEARVSELTGELSHLEDERETMKYELLGRWEPSSAMIALALGSVGGRSAEGFMAQARIDVAPAHGKGIELQEGDTVVVLKWSHEEPSLALSKEGYLNWYCQEMVDGESGRLGWVPSRMLEYDLEEMKEAKLAAVVAAKLKQQEDAANGNDVTQLQLQVREI